MGIARALAVSVERCGPWAVGEASRRSLHMHSWSDSSCPCLHAEKATSIIRTYVVQTETTSKLPRFASILVYITSLTRCYKHRRINSTINRPDRNSIAETILKKKGFEYFKFCDQFIIRLRLTSSTRSLRRPKHPIVKEPSNIYSS